MKSFKQFSEQAVAAAAPAPTPKFSAKVQPKPKVSDPSSGVDIDAQGRWQGQIVDTGQELEPGYEKKVKAGKSGPDPNIPAGIAALMGQLGVGTLNDLTKVTQSVAIKELQKMGYSTKEAKKIVKDYRWEVDKQTKGNDKQAALTNKKTGEKVMSADGKSRVSLGGGARGLRGFSQSAMAGARAGGKALASVVSAAASAAAAVTGVGQRDKF